MTKLAPLALALVVVTSNLGAQTLPIVPNVEPQPFVAQVARLMEALEFLGSALPAADARRLETLRDEAPTPAVVEEIQQILDRYVLVMVQISPEARVSVVRGPAPAEIVQHGWKATLVKVHNQGAVRGRLEVESPNAEPALFRSTGAPRAGEETEITPGQLANRFLEMVMYRRRPMLPNLSGLPLEYAILQINSTTAGQREARIGFQVGPGTQDLGFRNAIDVLFDCQPSVQVVLRVADHDGTPTMASFVITDGVERLGDDSSIWSSDYRQTLARRRAFEEGGPVADPAARSGDQTPGPGRLVGIYPLPSRRSATTDIFPDFYFHAQVYRSDGEYVALPPGSYDVTYTRGPEYVPQSKRITVPEGVEAIEESFQLQRWVDLSSFGWHSGDHHVHAAGCSHYESPEEGVDPEHMWRQALGEDLDVACVLNWGPSWYHQKQFFDGEVHVLSTDDNLLRYDVEVSGFPSSHAGHLVLLRLDEDDYPGTSLIEEWPSWTLPVLQWGQSQDGVVGYAHSGWGLEPMEPTFELPNYTMAKFDGIGANEYIMTVTHDAVDFISAGDTPVPWELNIWYHTLNSGFRTRISGETDFPCIYDDRVGMTRTYAKIDGPLDFTTFAEATKNGRSYVSEGGSHLVDFAVNGLDVGTSGSELRLPAAGRATVTARVTARLPVELSDVGAAIAARSLVEPPYWHIERARIGTSRRIPVELIVNGEVADRVEIEADGVWTDLRFDVAIERSSWVALRVMGSSHTNPIFVVVDDAPIRASRTSAEWCREAVDQCWLMKQPLIREEERAAAAAAYEHARDVYDRIISESVR
ncbi:MAG: CehA/McbA family metallohydrolase [Vicinamibacterales bacterium]|nr:CehA/McbA family metallohydrolase [Vicinamibacterales bacterium]|tara:strand:- start:5136 stop:7574 length:2439 start_codon:yes stop_codon:yes gene_type:complete